MASTSPILVDAAPTLGIDFQHDNGFAGKYYLPEEMGPGAGLLDFDGDGDLDAFIAGGGTIDQAGPAQSCRLYRNDGELFTDVTESSSAGVPGPAYGVACADYDDDGDVDILVTRLGASVLLQNQENGTFVDASAQSGVDGAGFGAGAAFFDYDRDGRLDLYIANYVDWSQQRERPCYSPRGTRDYCGPIVYQAPSQHRLYRNVGGGRFEDVSEASGIAAERGYGLGVMTHDFDGDGWMDIFVANDQSPGFLWRNQGNGTFENIATAAGCAYDARGMAIAGMGVACEDLDGDADFDIVVTNIREQPHIVFRNEGSRFADASLGMGMGKWSMMTTGFGIALFDQDNDGRLDAYVANGAVNESSRTSGLESPYAEPDHFVRLIDGRFIDATAGSGANPGDVGRALAAGDVDNDGDVDLLLTNNGGAVRLLRNMNSNGNSWLIVDARTGPGRRAATGAVITVVAGNSTQRRAVQPHSSCLASSDPRVHFGLGRASSVDEIRIRWTDGAEQTLQTVGVNQVLVIEQKP